MRGPYAEDARDATALGFIRGRLIKMIVLVDQRMARDEPGDEACFREPWLGGKAASTNTNPMTDREDRARSSSKACGSNTRRMPGLSSSHGIGKRSWSQKWTCELDDIATSHRIH